MNDNNHFQSLLKNLHEAFKSHPPEEINKAIIEFLNKKGAKYNEITFVLDNISGEYGMSRRTLIQSTSKGRISQAKNIAYCVLHYNLGLSIRHIANRVFGKTGIRSVFKSIKAFKSLNPEVKVDREFKEIYDRTVLRLNEYVKDSNK